jgi:adenylate kinase family enzyme
MTRVLITGMSGVGKSSVILELARRGLDAVDLETDDWCEWTIAPRPGDPSDAPERSDWIWTARR